MASKFPNAPSVAPLLSIRGSEGVFILNQVESSYSNLAKLDNFSDNFKNCRVSAFDPLGKYFAYSNATQVKIIDLSNGCKTVSTIDKPRTCYVKFSPLGTFVILWETFHISKEDKSEINNLNMYETLTGKLVKTMIQKKLMEKFIQWSSDESVFAIQTTNNIEFFEKSDPERFVKRLHIENLTSFSMHPVSKCFAAHSSGKKSEPSTIRLYQYPDIDTVLANKSFFNAFSVDFKWNKSGTNIMLLCSTETSENSYYGDTTLHQVSTNGENQIVQLSKKGPIYSLEWNPVKDEFIVVYGTMPAKATLFNGKCAAIFDFGTGPRNECFFNPHGNIVCLAGFGNLRGRVEMWNLVTSNRVPQEICSMQTDDTTYFEWCPDGEHFLAATTAPRLRVSNGFNIWHYLGEKKNNFMMPPGQGNELWQVQWQPGTYASKPVIGKNAAVVKEETKAYVPPHLRGSNKPADFKSKLHEDDEKPDKGLKTKIVEPKSEAEELEKKIKVAKKKLSAIDDLKAKQKAGDKLEKNQLDKLNNEKDLIEELKKLELEKKKPAAASKSK